ARAARVPSCIRQAMAMKTDAKKAKPTKRKLLLQRNPAKARADSKLKRRRALDANRSLVQRSTIVGKRPTAIKARRSRPVAPNSNDVAVRIRMCFALTSNPYQ